MAQAKSGDKVAVHYTGKLQDGSVFDSSAGRDPLEFVIGAGMVVPGFDAAVAGMEPGEKKEAEISSEQAYGAAREELKINVKREEIPENLDVTVGQRLAVRTPDNREVPVMVTEVSDAAVTLDANHPLAGKDLIFDIELVAIR